MRRIIVREARVHYRKVSEIDDDGLLTSPATVANAVRDVLGDDPREHFVVIYTDARLRQIAVEVVSIGTLSQSLVHPREVFRTAILKSAASIIVAHNHPSGDHKPSPEDHSVTRRLLKAGEVLGIALTDHVIVGSDSFYSFAQEGQLS